MSLAYRCRFAALLVLALVLTSLPARVWLFGACPVCGNIHVPILVVQFGTDVGVPTPSEDPREDIPTSPHDDRLAGHCVPPLPYCPTTPAESPIVSQTMGELRSEAEPHVALVPATSLIRPPRV